jgi:hypothetical protein
MNGYHILKEIYGFLMYFFNKISFDLNFIIKKSMYFYIFKK